MLAMEVGEEGRGFMGDIVHWFSAIFIGAPTDKAVKNSKSLAKKITSSFEESEIRKSIVAYVSSTDFQVALDKGDPKDNYNKIKKAINIAKISKNPEFLLEFLQKFASNSGATGKRDRVTEPQPSSTGKARTSDNKPKKTKTTPAIPVDRKRKKSPLAEGDKGSTEPILPPGGKKVKSFREFIQQRHWRKPMMGQRGNVNCASFDDMLVESWAREFYDIFAAAMLRGGDFNNESVLKRLNNSIKDKKASTSDYSSIKLAVVQLMKQQASPYSSAISFILPGSIQALRRYGIFQCPLVIPFAKNDGLPLVVVPEATPRYYQSWPWLKTKN